MQWNDSGLILSVRKHGENSVIIHAFTRGYGRYAGLVRGGVGRRLRGILQPGNEVELTWRSRIADQLGAFTVEPRKSRASDLFDTPDALAGASSALALLDIVLPEREAHAALFDATMLLFDSLADSPGIWPLLLARWELGLLGEIGYGLDLTQCAASGVTTDLIYVSPKSGRAVSRQAGEPYRDRLLPLPAFLGLRSLTAAEEEEIADADILNGLRLTGYFVEKFMSEHHPAVHLSARERMMTALSRRYEAAGAKKIPENDSL
ncbi:DNA repair protein RecO [Sneathiella chungangensis]|uniref:DNA repair protein RecO n=1 Tax=Sneathiella chungangensis TaxID=1418234 RepID=A0A845MD12_9PROT|nr:DNA repair protein RecO [Sneathiella chungangensis]MZR21551.1 DNA repair protein RecO [Sneathiella chungangensis]